MKSLMIIIVLLVASVSVANWSDNFDSYAAGSGIIGQGGWLGWGGATDCDALISTAQARSSANSVEVKTNSDVIQEFNMSRGQCTLSAWNYIPSGATGQQFFILLTSYAGNDSHWALNLQFDADLNEVMAIEDSTAIAAIVYDKWVEVKVDIDLDSNSQSIYYDSALLTTVVWSKIDEYYFDAVDLYSKSGSAIYWDDLTLVETTQVLTPSTWAVIKTSF